MVEYCPECGKKFEEAFKFCPACGTEIPEMKKEKKKEKVKTKEKTETKKKVEIKEKTDKKEKVKTKEKKKTPSHKLSLNISRKTAIVVVSIICFAAIVVAGVIVISPFDNMAASVDTVAAGRTFTITVENTHAKDADCYLTIDGLRQLECGLAGFTVNSGESKQITINEDELMYHRSSYEIKLFAAINNVIEIGVASGVTESAEFSINNGGEYPNIECTGST